LIVAMAPAATQSQADPAALDFRVRVAAQKRERMRERLIAATLDAYLDADPGWHPVIDDVIRTADVSRGTFYKYFDSLDEVLAEIGQRMAGEMLASFERLFADVADGAVRTAAGPLMAMARAAMEPRHGAFISRVDFVDFFDGTDPRSLIVGRCLEAGRAQGRLKFESLDAAVDLVIGASVEGARRVLKARALTAAYIRETAVMVMLGLGLTRKAAESAVDQAWQHLHGHASELHWWQPGTAVLKT
jgi:AcrR family transcriptional regulator